MEKLSKQQEKCIRKEGQNQFPSTHYLLSYNLLKYGQQYASESEKITAEDDLYEKALYFLFNGEHQEMKVNLANLAAQILDKKTNLGKAID